LELKNFLPVLIKKSQKWPNHNIYQKSSNGCTTGGPFFKKFEKQNLLKKIDFFSLKKPGLQPTLTSVDRIYQIQCRQIIAILYSPAQALQGTESEY
jgi:hypothetical protein